MRRQFTITLLTVLLTLTVAHGQTDCKFKYTITDSAGLCMFSSQPINCPVQYPKTATEKNIEGKVIVSYNISDNCTMTDIKVVKGLGYGLDEIAINLVKEFGNDIKKNNSKCCFSGQQIVPVIFSLK